MKRSLRVTIALTAAATSVFGQVSSTASKSDRAELFEINRTRSFSASRTPSADPASPTAASREVRQIVSSVGEALSLIRSQYVSGDRLDLEVSLKRNIRNMALYTGIARVDGEQVACAEILCAEVKA